MLEQSLLAAAQRELMHYGRNPEGNYVLSPESFEEILRKLIKVADAALERPVITTTYHDVISLCRDAGLRVESVIQDNMALQKIYDKSGTVEIYEEAQNLVNATVTMVLQRIHALTQLKKE